MVTRKRIPFGPVVAYLQNLNTGISYPSKIGYAFKNHKGQISLRLNCVPLESSGWDGWLNVFEETEEDRKANTEKRTTKKSKTPTTKPDWDIPPHWERDDDVPF